MRKLWVVLPATLVVGLLGLLFARFGPYVGFLERDQPHPEGHDDVVVRVEASAGMGTEQSFFSDAPDLVVTGDGTAYAYRSQSVTGLVQPVVTFHLEEGGVQDLLKRGAHDRLLADHAPYPSPSGVLDGGSTDVLLATDRGRWTHSAYALDSGSWGFGVRARLADFVDATRSVAARAAATSYRPTALLLLVVPSTDPEPGVAAWPEDTGVDLATIDHCGVVTSPAAIEILTGSSDRLYREHGQLFELAAAVSLPGDTCTTGSGS